MSCGCRSSPWHCHRWRLIHGTTTDALVAVLNDLAVADDRVTMFEYCLTRLVWNYLLDAADPSRRSKVGNGSLHDVRPVVTTLLATLAVASGGDQDASARAFHGAMQRLYGADAAAENPRQLSWQQTLDGGWAQLDALEPKAKQALVEAMVDAVTRRRHGDSVGGRNAARGLRVDARPAARATRLIQRDLPQKSHKSAGSSTGIQVFAQ